MANKTIFVLGGYGGTGRVVSRRLLQHTDANIVIGGRNLEKAEAVAAALRREYGPERVRVAAADAGDLKGLTKVLEGCDMILVASTTPQYVTTVARAAIAAGCDYLDYHFNNDVPAALETLRGEVERAGRCFITQAGFHPGLPAVFVRYASAYFSQYSTALVGMIMNAPIENPDSIYELVDELQHPSAEVYKGGVWRKATWRDGQAFDFGRFGKKMCFPLRMLEMRPLPMQFGLQHTGVFVAGFNWFTDYVVFPLGLLIGRIHPGSFRRPLAHLLAWGMNTFPAKEPGVMFVLDARGEKDGKPVHVRIAADHSDAYEFTAIPVVGCVKQYFSGDIKKPGIWMMGHAVNPERLFEDMKEMGVLIRIDPSLHLRYT